VGYNVAWPQPVVVVLGYLAFINGLVLVFNLVPAFPLDGGRVLRSILWAMTGNVRQATQWASLLGQMFAWILTGFGIWQLYEKNWLGGIWMGLIGFFLYSAARQGYQQVLIRQALEGEPIGRFMNAHPIVVPPSLDLQHWVEDFVYRYHHRSFPVASNGHLEGIITTKAMAQIPREEWAAHTVSEVMTPDLQAVTIRENADAMEALGKMQRTGSNRLLVTADGELRGIVSLGDLLHFLNLMLELEQQEHARS
jgi:CBS domain-containing protein